VPVRAEGRNIVDNGGDVIATCFTPTLASKIANLLNDDAAMGGFRPVIGMPARIVVKGVVDGV